MGQVKSSFDILNGIDDSFGSSFLDSSLVQPLQMIPAKLKTPKWIKHNADYIEWQGLEQIKNKSKRLLKNYNLAAGILNKDEYLLQDLNPDEQDVFDNIVDEDNPLPDAMELQFFPLIPTYIETLQNEYTERGTSKIDYRAVDDISVNDIIEKKQADVEKVLLEYGQKKVMAELMNAGYPINDPSIKEQLAPPNLREKLPEINSFYQKNYRTIFEVWSTKMHNIDKHRFNMDEKERTSFGDYLRTDSCYWYFHMKESDYEVRLLNPILTFTHLSPHVEWASEGNYGGFFDVLSVADAIDEDGQFMDEETMRSLESLLPAQVDATYRDMDEVNVGGTWNPAKSYDENRKYSTNMRRHAATFNSVGHDIVDYIIGQTSDKKLMHGTGMLRRTTMFWKTQRKIGVVFEIKENNQTDLYTVDENWVQQVNPVYNTKFQDLRNSETLVYGQHVDWQWVNETWGCKKYSGTNTAFSLIDDEDPLAIYLGIGTKKPGPIPFQFKSSVNKWGCLLPIEGRNFTNRNTESRSAVDLLKPAQILFNISNNQVTDIMSDENGPILVLDQNSIPKHSMEGSWGAHNYAKARGVMNEYQILPLDHSMANTESVTQINHTQVLDMSQTNRLMSRLQISRYAKELANDIMGFSPARAGQQSAVTTNGGPTATEVKQTQVGSFNRTETYFINHADYLMPRVHTMRTNLAQYYYSKKPSFILNLMISPDERALFEINGTELLGRDLQVFAENSSNRRSIMNNILQWVMTNNTAGATILDGPELMQVESLSELNQTIIKINERQQKQAELAHQRELEKIKEQAKAEQLAIDKQNNFEALQNMLDRQARHLDEQIRSSGYAASQDINSNSISDQMDLINSVKEDQVYQDQMGLEREKMMQEKEYRDKELALKNRKISADLIKSANAVTVSTVNKNKFDK